MDRSTSDSAETASESHWGDSPAHPVLSRNEVHIWRVQLNAGAQQTDLLKEILAQDELARAARFHFERDRSRFITARAHLRIILARYLELDPKVLEFSYGSNGKPALSERFRNRGPEFNLSHSAGLALVAVTLDRKVGVDLERIRLIHEAEHIAGRFFSTRENEALSSLSQPEKIEGFFRCWTCKEAYLKAEGDGLMRPSASFDVAFNPAERTRLVSIDGDSTEALGWKLLALAPSPGYVGAVAVTGHDWALKCWAYRE